MSPRRLDGRLLGLRLLTILTLFLVHSPAPAFGAEPCPNEQLRTESSANPTTGHPYSAQLPDCRAYELVSPPNTGGISAINLETTGPKRGGGLSVMLAEEGAAVFYTSQASPPGTGSLPHGRQAEVFRSVRAAGGWSTRDVTPFGFAEAPGVYDSAPMYLRAVSSDGASILVDTRQTLSPADRNNGAGDLYALRDGQPPALVTIGVSGQVILNQLSSLPLEAIANGDLTSVGFTSKRSLEPADPDVGNGSLEQTYQWTDVGSPFATLVNPVVDPSRQNSLLFAITPDGRPIYADTSGDANTGGIYTSEPEGAVAVQFKLAPPGGTFDALSPDGSTVYLTSAAQLTAEATGTNAEIYAVTIGNLKNITTTCVSCGALDGTGTSEDVRFATLSSDGSRVFFATQSGAGTLWEHDATGTHEVSSTSGLYSGPNSLTISQNGHYAIVATRQALAPADTNGTPDVYELSTGSLPKLITNGVSVGTGEPYTPVAVSDGGLRVIYDERPPSAGAPEVINEWVGGQPPVQLSPQGSASPYTVAATAGPELEDVFFVAHDPLVPYDQNAGTADVYDARVDGGFAAPSEPANNNQTPNPVGAPTPAYTGSLPPPSLEIGLLPPDTSHSTTTIKPLTRAQKLAKALKVCKKDKKKSTRLACEKSAHKKYATPAKKSAHRKGRK